MNMKNSYTLNDIANVFRKLIADGALIPSLAEVLFEVIAKELVKNELGASVPLEIHKLLEEE